MKANNTLLYVHRDAGEPRRMERLLRGGGYSICSAASGPRALRLAAHRDIAAVVIDDGVLRSDAGVATRIKHSKPQLPIVMMTNHARVPQRALNAVDAQVAKEDPPEFLLATLHFFLNVQPPRKRRS